MLANLIVARRPSRIALLRGYGEPPDKATLRWYTAASLLARVALPRSAATAPTPSPACVSCSTPAPPC